MPSPDAVHLLIRHRSTWEGTWKTVLAVLTDGTDAGLRALALGESETDPDVSYYAEEHGVVGIGEPLPPDPAR